MKLVGRRDGVRHFATVLSIVVVSWAAIALIAAAARAAAVEIEVGNAVAQPDGTASFSVVLHSDGVEVANVQNDIGFDAEAAVAITADGTPDCAVNVAINKDASIFTFQPPGCEPGVTCGAVRAIVLALDNVAPIPDGSVLYRCRLVIAADTPAVAHSLPCSNVGSSDPEGTPLATSCLDGQALLSGVEIEIGYAVAQPGNAVFVDVVLHAGLMSVAGIQNDIAFDATAPIVATADGVPDCVVNGAIDKPDTNFAFQPPGCEPGVTCTAMRAMVLAFDNVTLIADESVLYTCRVQVAADEPSAPHFLLCSGVEAIDPDGNLLATTCRDGEVLLPGGSPRPTPTRVSTPTRTLTRTPTSPPTPPRGRAEIEIGYAVAEPGDEALVSVVLHSDGIDIAGTQNDIGFDPEAPIAATERGAPDCSVNPAINKAGTSFAFQPPSCQPARSCTAVRALVLALDNTDPIPDGSALYTCRVAFAADAPAVPHFLACSHAGASDATGYAPPTTCRDGEVLLPGGSPRPTRTRMPPAAATPTGTLRSLPTPAGTAATPSAPGTTATPSATAPPLPPATPDQSGASSGGDGGCSVTDGSGSAWQLLLALPLLLMRWRTTSTWGRGRLARCARLPT